MQIQFKFDKNGEIAFTCQGWIHSANMLLIRMPFHVRYFDILPCSIFVINK